MADDFTLVSETTNRQEQVPALRLVEYIVARLCHDLSGALNTVNNALDIAAEEADAAVEALSLAAEGGRAMNARLRMLRSAWGGGAGPLAMAEIVEMMEGLSGRHRLRIETGQVTDEALMPAPVTRVLLNILMVAAESLPFGGTINMVGSSSGGIAIMISGRNAAWPAGLPGWLASRQTAWAAIDSPRQVAGPLAILLADAEGISLSMLLGGSANEVPPLLVRWREPSQPAIPAA